MNLFIRPVRLGLFGGLLMASIGAAVAQQRYVSDELVITLRTGPSTQNAIVRNLSSGDRVTILEEGDDERYVRVRTDDGMEGWVLVQYLQDGPTGGQLRAVAERELAAARDRIAELQEEVAGLRESLATTSSELESSRTTGASMRSELDEIRQASASAIELRDQNENLRRRITELSAQLDLVTMENSDLRSRTRQNWFVVGAAVLLGGVVIGLVAPSLRPRKKSSW